LIGGDPAVEDIYVKRLGSIPVEQRKLGKLDVHGRCSRDTGLESN
jgi:hypothetical protein